MLIRKPAGRRRGRPGKNWPLPAISAEARPPLSCRCERCS